MYLYLLHILDFLFLHKSDKFLDVYFVIFFTYLA